MKLDLTNVIKQTYEPVDTINYNKGRKIKLSIPHPERGFMTGVIESSSRPFDIDNYTNILNPQDIRLEDLDWLNEARAANQSALRLVSSAVGQTVTTIVGDILSGAGAILALPKIAWHGIRTAWDEDAKYDFDKAFTEGLAGALMEGGKDVSEFGREYMPIYQTKEAQKGGFGGGMADATWWASMFPTVGSAVASMIPVMGGVKAVSLAGKGLSAVNSATKLGRFANVVGRGLSSRSAQIITGGILGGHLDVALEIAHARDEQIAYAKSLGMSDEDAVKFASEYAAEAYKDGILYGLIFNTIEMATLLKTPNNIITGTRANKFLDEGLDAIKKYGSKATIGKIDDIALSKLDYAKSFGKKSKDFFVMGISEGLEEMRVDLALQEGEVKAKEAFGLEDYRLDTSEIGRWGDLASKTNSWDSFIWGAIGGMVLGAGRGVIQKSLYSKEQQKFEADRVTNILNSVQKLAKVLETSDGTLDLKMVNKEVEITNPDGTTRKEFRPVINKPLEELMPTIIALSSESNSYAYAKNYLESLVALNDEEFVEMYGDISKKETAKSLIREFDTAARIISKNKSIGIDSDPNVNHLVRRSMNTQEYMLHYYTNQQNKVETELKRIHKLRERYNLYDIDNKLDSLETQVEEYDAKIKSLEDVLSEIDTQIKSTKESIQTNVEGQIEAENDAISLEAEIKSKRRNLQTLYSQHRIAKAKIFELSRDKKNSRTEAMREAKAEFKRINQEISNIESEINNLEEQLSVGLTSPTYRHNVLIGDAEILQSRQKELEKKREGIIAEHESAKKIHQSLIEERKEYRESRPRVAQQYDEAREKNQTQDIDAQDQSEENLIKLNDHLNRQIDALERSLTTDRQKTIESLTEGSKALVELQKKTEEAKKEQEKREAEAKKKKEKEEKKKKRLGTKTESEERETTPTENVENGSVAETAPEEKPVEIADETEEFDDDSLTMIVSETDKNGTSYEVQTSPDNSQKGRILGVKIGAISISKGDKIILHNKVYTIEKIEIVEDNISVTVNHNGTSHTYSIEELIDAGISLINKNDYVIYEKLNKLEEALNSTTNLEQQLKYIIDHLSDIKTILNSNTRNIVVLQNIRAITSRMQNIYESAFAKSDIKDKYLNKWRDVANANKFDFTSQNNSIDTAINRANFINHMMTLIDLSSIADFDTIITDTNGNITVKRNAYKAQLVESIVNELETIANQLFTNNNIGFDFDKTFNFKFYSNFNENTIPIITEGLSRLLNSELANNFPQLKDIIDKVTFNIIAEFNNRVNYLISSKLKDTDFGTYIDTLNNYINSLLANPEFASTLPLLQDVKEYLNAMHRIVTNYTSGKPVTTSDVELVDKLYDKLNSILTSNKLADLQNHIKTTYGFDISENLAHSLLTGKLHTYYTDLKQAQGLYYTAINTTRSEKISESSDYVLFALDLLNDIDSNLDEIVEIAKDAIEKGKSINTILSDELKSLITLFDEIIARMRLNPIFEIDTFNYENILLGLLQLPGGYDMVRSSYQNIFNALRVLFDKNSVVNIDNLIKTFGKYGNLDIEAQTILNRLENLKNSVDPDPFENLLASGNYSLVNGLSKNWINDFLDNNRIQLFERVNHEGMRRLTPAIYKELANKEIFDATTNTYTKETIELFGEQFTIEEVFEQLKQLNVDQEFQVEKISIDGKEYFNIYKKLKDGRKFVVEQIGLTDSDTYFGIPLSHTTEAGTVVYDSVFGNIHGLSKEINDFIAKSLKSKTYEVIKEFYQFFKKYEVGNKYREHYDDLMKILSKLETLGDAGSAMIESLNQFIHKVDPEFDHGDLDMNHLEAVYRIITPMFYNLRDVSKLKLNKTYIKNAYANINGKLAQDFYHLQQLKSEYELDNDTTVILKGINKSPILFTDRKVTNNLDKVVSKDGNLNGNPVIEIISRQPAPEGGTSTVKGSQTVSSLTLTSNVKDDTISQHRMSKENNHHELYVKVKSNDSTEGYSYIPIVRGTLNTINIERDSEIEDLQNKMMNQVVSDISQLIVNPYYTFSKDSSPAEIEAYYNTLASLSKYVIVDEARMADKGSGFFKVGGVFNNSDGTKSKAIVFRVGLPSSRSSNRLSTYEVSLDVVYNSDNTINHINVYKHLVSVNGRYHKNETPILSKKFKASYKEGSAPITRRVTENGITKTVTDSKTLKRHVIQFDKNSDVQEVLNQVLGEIVGNMYRAVNTAWVAQRDEGSAYGYGEVYYEKNEKGGYTRKYRSFGTTEKYIINGVTFDSYQDFLIKTGAVQISATAIKSKSGKVLSNYDITSNVPAMWFKTKSEIQVQTEEQKKDIVKPVIDDRIVIKNKIEAMRNDSQLWFDSLSNNKSLYEALGIINETTSAEAFDIIRKLFTQGIVEKQIKLVIDNKMGDKTRAAISTKNGVSTLKINNKYLNSQALDKLGFGAYMIHEALHAYMNTLVDTPEYNNVIVKLHNLRQQLVDSTNELSLEEFNSKFNSNLTENDYKYLKEYLDKSKLTSKGRYKSMLPIQEMITYAFTDKTLSDILNRIQYTSEEQTKQSPESFWKKLLNTLLELLGINVRKDTVLNEIKSIIENAYGVVSGVETNIEISTEVGVQPTPLPAVTNITTDIVKNSLVKFEAINGSKQSEIVYVDGRYFVVVNMNGINIPFYMSSGLGGKKSVQSGKWYPFFGVSEQGWLNKTTEEEINNYYNSPELKAISEALDNIYPGSEYGISKDDVFIRPIGKGETVAQGNFYNFKEVINKDLNPTENKLLDTTDKVRENINKVINSFGNIPTSNKLNLDLSDIDDGSDLYSEVLETADREAGLTPALTIIENNVDNILKNQRNLLSSSAELVTDFQDKYTDALNDKIC